LIGLSVATLIAAGLSYWTALPFLGAFVLVLGAMLINGVIAEKEDNAPGGFNNPTLPADSKKEPIQPSATAHKK